MRAIDADKLLRVMPKDDVLLSGDVRRMVCRLFGVAKGMTCSHGNSAEIDSAGLIDFGQPFCGCQNGMGWNVSERPE